ncbi:MAG: PIG-L family deacetylase [Planctomycetota bacterium]
MPAAPKPVVLAIAAHPDDIEFMFAGTLLRLRNAGAEIHFWNLANGSCGTATHSREEIIRLRGAEAQASARLAGAVLHEPLADDIAIYYEPSLLARVAAVVRQVKPTVLLTHSPQDYMEDHQNACRLSVSAAFVRGMRNFATAPAVLPFGGATTVYHALPHSLRDCLGKLLRPGQYVDIGPVLARKRELLGQHRTQKEWLDVSQGMDAYLLEMEEIAREVGRMSGRFEFAEGWRRHSYLGFCAAASDPLTELLGQACWTDPEYERGLG